MKEILERMHNEQLYNCYDEDLLKEQVKYLDYIHAYNLLRPSQQKEKQELMKKMFADIGEDCYLETPFYANWGGKHVHLGNKVYANFHLTLVDDTHIYLDDHVMIGPNVTICSATHPIDPALRQQQIQYNKPVHLHKNVWVGANVMIMPGVTIGENSIIGAGSVVTKDIPANVIAFGNPCVVYREIHEHDKKFYDGNKIIDL